MEETFMFELLRGYKKVCRVLAIALFVCLGIITLFISGFVYVVTNYDFFVETNEVETSTGNACVGDACNNGEINGIR